MGNKGKRKGPSAPSERVTFEFTEMRNAERLLETAGDWLRYVGPWDMWLVWDKRRWKLDEDGGALRFAKKNAQKMAAEAAVAIKRAQAMYQEELEDDAAEIESEGKKRGRPRKPKASEKTTVLLKNCVGYKKWCETSQNLRNLQNTLSIAATDRSMVLTHDKLDVEHFLFNVENGTVDLRTGRLRKHRRDDLITKMAPIKFKRSAKCPRWEKFVSEAMGGNEELVTYLQRFVGYSLTGSTQEHALVFFYGEGNNGKSTFLTTLYRMFGDYSLRAARGLLFRSKHGNERHPTSLASLHGKRFVTCAEIGENQELDDELTKDLTGSDPINARRMREDEWNFLPTHKLFLAGNHKPRITGTDKGIWRRNNLVPWAVNIPDADVDKGLPDKLLKEASGVLNWCIEGCLAWQEHGLNPPDAVIRATEEYRVEQDVVGQFLDELLVFEKEALIERSVLRKAYEDWCEKLGHMAVGARKLSQALRSKGVTDGSVWDPGGRGARDAWVGVRLARRKDLAKRELKRRGKEMTKEERAIFKLLAKGKKPKKKKIEIKVTRRS